MHYVKHLHVKEHIAFDATTEPRHIACVLSSKWHKTMA